MKVLVCRIFRYGGTYSTFDIVNKDLIENWFIPNIILEYK